MADSVCWMMPTSCTARFRSIAETCCWELETRRWTLALAARLSILALAKSAFSLASMISHFE
jgi:hypothetical protein